MQLNGISTRLEFNHFKSFRKHFIMLIIDANTSHLQTFSICDTELLEASQCSSKSKHILLKNGERLWQT